MNGPGGSRVVGGLGALAVGFLALPLLALLLRVPWSRVGEILGSGAAREALWVSAQVSVAALVLSLIFGVPLAWLLARFRFPGRRVVRSLATLPMVLPPVVGGVALLLAFGRRGLVGGPLESFAGVTIPFTGWAAILAATFVSMPFLVTTVEAGFAGMDARLEEAASTLGAGRWRTFIRVVVPMVAPSLGAGMAMSWARALGEFGATITFAGNIPGATQTMPLAVYLQLEQDPEVAYLLSSVLLAVSLLVLGLTFVGRSGR
ncbi:MAG TPA: ABC transporter permease [Acidimicrobiia bacterium]|nr:ABC transporter permease [Acidimicrobiia bacterium]